MKCEMCEAEPSVHICELQANGSTIERHFCELHAREAGMARPSSEQSALTTVPILRSLASFIRSNHRMPTPDEMKQFHAAGDLTQTSPGTQEFDRQLAYLEELADFIEKNRRFPTEQEMPDPF